MEPHGGPGPPMGVGGMARAFKLGTILWKPPLDGLEFLRWLLMAIKGLLMAIKGSLMAIKGLLTAINGY